MRQLCGKRSLTDSSVKRKGRHAWHNILAEDINPLHIFHTIKREL